MWTIWADGGRPGSDRVPVWDDTAYDPSGKITCWGVDVGRMLVRTEQSLNAKKWPEDPESGLACTQEWAKSDLYEKLLLVKGLVEKISDENEVAPPRQASGCLGLRASRSMRWPGPLFLHLSEKW